MLINHTQWLRLQAQGEFVCSALKAHDYQILKHRSTLQWRFIKEGQADYLFCWLPQPIHAWALLPNDCSETRSQLLEIIHGILAQSSYQPLFPLENYGHSRTGTTALQRYVCQVSESVNC